MVASLTYRTNDGTRWGGGLGSDLSATQVDLNFWTLFSALSTLESNEAVNAGIDYINQPANGNLFYIHLTDHRVLGPFVIPTAQWNPRGIWAATTAYSLYDVVSNNGSLYLVITAHTSAGTFNAAATDGLGHNLYALVLTQPSYQIPAGGNIGDKLVKNSATDYDLSWKADKLRISLFVEGQTLASETLLKYCVVDNMVIKAGLPGTYTLDGVNSSADAVFTITKNGFPVGYLTFNGVTNGNNAITTFAADVTFAPGDTLYIIGPTVPDATLTDVSITIVAQLLP